MVKSRQKKKRGLYKAILIAMALAIVVAASVWLLHDKNFAVLNTAGTIGDQERNLFIFASLLSLVVVVPVFALTFYIARTYRVGNRKAKYSPDFDHHKGIEALWWGIPLALIVVLSVVTWVSSHKLDPFRPIGTAGKPLEIQVVALQWKWLFIYPEQNMASVNFVQFPEDREVKFVITSDAPMNSFWIPQLGGQIYAMSGMSTNLHLMADEPGEYRGFSANISGEGFASMTFTAKSSTQADFDAWVQSAKQSSEKLTVDSYNKLAVPSEKEPVAYYASVDHGLYDEIVNQYMSHPRSGGARQPNQHSTEHQE